MIQTIIQGCKAGTLAGFIWGILVLGFISPIIQKAEVYEEQGAAQIHVQSSLHQNSDSGHKHSDSDHQHSHSHHEHSHEFQPNFWQRPLLTVLGTTLLGIAFGILASISFSFGIRAKSITWKGFLNSPLQWGLGMGLIGFAVFQGIPALGLRPALPGVVGAEFDYSARQSWWLLTVFCSVLALGAVTFGWSYARKEGKFVQTSLVLIAVLVMAFPFLGQGVPAYSKESVTPISLQEQFIFLSLTVSLIFWLILGTTFAQQLRRLDVSRS